MAITFRKVCGKTTILRKSSETFLLGAYIMANSWLIFTSTRMHVTLTSIRAMTHDASVFPEPHAFTPERFLTPEGQLKPNSQIDSFGFGRRSI